MGSTIVLADDEAEIRALYAPLLRAAGHTVWEATGGRDALALVALHRPSLLLLDVWMPEMSGFEVLERLRDDPASSALRVVMLSNMSDADTRLECFEMGAVDYLVKGIALSDLRDQVDRVLGAPSPS